MKLRLPELHYNLGHVLHQQGDLANAVLAYQQAIELDHSFAQAHHSLAVILDEQKQYQAAAHHYRQVLALQPNAVKAYNNLGCNLVQQEQVEQALQVYQQAIARQPNWAVLYNNFGRAIEVQDPTTAVAAFQRAIELDPDLRSAHYNLGQVWLQQRQYQAALECFQRLLLLEPAHAEAHTGCGIAWQALGDLERALPHFYQALSSQRAPLEAFCQWAGQLQATDELALARKACSQLLQRLLQVGAGSAPSLDAAQQQSISRSPAAPESQPPWHSLLPDLAQTYLHLGNLLMRYGGATQYRQAEYYYQQALQCQPQDLTLFLKLGECLGKQQRWNAALMTYHWALTIHPQTAALHQGLGWVLEQQQRWQEAISHYQKALELSKTAAYPDAEPPFQPDSQQGLSRVNSSVTSAIQSVWKTTSSWCRQNQHARYLALEPDQNHLLQPQAVTESASEAFSSMSADAALSSSSQPSCAGLNCRSCLKRIVNQFAPVHQGKGVHRCQANAALIEPMPYFVTAIPQGQAWMSPYETDWMVANSVAILTAEGDLLADLSREYPGQLPGCKNHASFHRLAQPQQTELEQIPGQVAVLSGLSGHNYFHWMVDVLPRLELLQRSGMRLADIDWFWVNQPQAAFQQETLRLLGIPAQKVLAGDSHPRIQAEQLIVPSFAGHLGWLEPWALAFLRRQFLPLAAAATNQPERIYISRSRANHRRVLNEAAILEHLQGLGFVAVELELLSLAEQISLFAQAKAIVAPHGGGLTNLIFCNPGTTVIECFAPSYIRHYYWVISQQLGLNHFFLEGEKFICQPIHQLMYPSPLMEDIWVDPAALNLALAQSGLQ